MMLELRKCAGQLKVSKRELKRRRSASQPLSKDRMMRCRRQIHHPNARVAVSRVFGFVLETALQRETIASKLVLSALAHFVMAFAMAQFGILYAHGRRNACVFANLTGSLSRCCAHIFLHRS